MAFNMFYVMKKPGLFWESFKRWFLWSIILHGYDSSLFIDFGFGVQSASINPYKMRVEKSITN